MVASDTSDKASPGGGVHYLDISADQAGQRVDNFLHTYLRGAPRSLVYRLLRTGQVRVNGGRAKPTQRLSAGDRVRIPPVPGSQGEGERQVPAAALQRIREAIVYEDSRQLVVNKPSGMAVHAGSGLNFGVVDAVRELRPQRQPQLVHRLDRSTSGLLLLALDRETLKIQQQAFQQGRVGKYYLALLHGRMREDKVEVDAPLRRTHDAGAEESVVVDAAGKPALTEFRRLESWRDYTLVEARLATGRTHQIRVHAAHMGCPLAGDERYGDKRQLQQDRERGLKRLFLHAHRLDLDWPESILVSSPLSDDLHEFTTTLARR
ncbi:MAG: 23S rRNA pseudouridine(955/2504/2580) synthase RluC [Wenzhouxiangellaceae bacterium]